MKKIRLKNNRHFFILLFLIVAAQATVWMLAVPLLSGPDEPSHIVTSAADIRGQFKKRSATGLVPAFQTVVIPGTFALLRNESQCLYRSSSQPANCKLSASFCLQITGNAQAVCGLPLVGNSTKVATITQSGRYPPLYSLITGIPSMLSTRPGVIYFMRFMSVLLDSMYVALAIYSVYRWSSNSLMVAGIALTLTPMAIYLMAVVNPSGFEISSALCLWVSGMVLVTEKFKKVPTGLLDIALFSCLGLILSRPDSPFFAIFILAVLGYIAEPTLRRLLKGSHRFRLYLGLGVVVWVVAMIWNISQKSSLVVPGTLFPKGSTTAYIARSVLGAYPEQFNQMIGVLGWNNAPVPFATLALWYGGIGCLVVLGLSMTTKKSLRKTVALLLTLGTVAVLPLAYTLASAMVSGNILQGRYIYPIAIGVVIIAATLVSNIGRAKPQLARMLLLVTTVGNSIAFIWILRRYTVGLSTLNLLAHVPNGWSPPLPILLLIIIYIAVSLAMLSVLYKISSSIAKREVDSTN